jgi:RNA polymerase sigma-70 factor (ECF subfamily)
VASRVKFNRLLADLRAGEEGVSKVLLPLVYEELRGLAIYYMRHERPDHTLQPTALVHEAYIRLSGAGSQVWKSRSHFLHVAARAMRRVLIDHARQRRSDKCEESWIPKWFEEKTQISDKACSHYMALDSALDRLYSLDPQMVKVVELRFFAGMTIDETAQVMSISPRKVKRDWSLAKAWLKDEIRQRPEEGG